ncbi:MAG TPA: hypothetical protein VJ750_04025 [Rhizomicrobium sp.]|nr:hypothetical protein [Rhizomicrobium sp.]
MADIFPTTNDLLVAFPSGQVLVNGTTTITGARSTPGDHGGAMWSYDSADTTSADNGGNIRVDAAGRRWKAIVGAYMPATLFGVSASAVDNTAALNGAFIAAANLNITVGLGGMTLKVNGTLTWDQSRTGFDGQGGTLDFTGMTTTIAMQPTTTCTDISVMFARHNMRPIQNMTVIGPGTGWSLCFVPAAIIIAGTPWMIGMIFQNIVCNSFGVFCDITSGMVFPVFRDIVMGGHSYWLLRSMGNVNCGENILCDRCFVTATGFYLEEVQNDNLDLQMNSCSIDGCEWGIAQGVLASTPTAGVNGNITINGGHWEAFSGGGRILWCGGNGYIRVNNVNWVCATNWSIEPFRTDATGRTGGIVLNEVNMNGTVFAMPELVLCAGTGRFVITGGGQNGITEVFDYGWRYNRQSDYYFAANGADQWSPVPVLDAVDHPPGAAKSAIAAAGTVYQLTTPCLPGQFLSVLAQLKFTSLGAGDTFNICCSYRDKNNNILLGSQRIRTISTALNIFTYVDVSSDMAAPAGTEKASMEIIYNPGSGGGGASAKFGLPRVIVR